MNFSIIANLDNVLGVDQPAIARGSNINGNIEALEYFLNALHGLRGGRRAGQAIHIQWFDSSAIGNDATAGPGVAAFLGSTLTGSVGGTFGAGATAVTVTAAGGDTATMTLLAAAIRANTTVNRLVDASNLVASIGLTSVTAGTQISICGTTFTAVATAAAILQFGQFNIDGTDTQDAAALALAINRHPNLSGRVRAVANTGAGTVYVGLIDGGRSAVAVERINNPGTGFTVTNGALAATSILLVSSIQTGLVANEISYSATGTGMTTQTNGVVGRLGGATGGGGVGRRIVAIP